MSLPAFSLGETVRVVPDPDPHVRPENTDREESGVSWRYRSPRSHRYAAGSWRWRAAHRARSAAAPRTGTPINRESGDRGANPGSAAESRPATPPEALLRRLHEVRGLIGLPVAEDTGAFVHESCVLRPGSPIRPADLVKGARQEGLPGGIPGRALGLHLPGFAASVTDLPVIGVPFAAAAETGSMPLLATAQLPRRTGACVGIDTPDAALPRSVFSRPDVRVGIGTLAPFTEERPQAHLGGGRFPSTRLVDFDGRCVAHPDRLYTRAVWATSGRCSPDGPRWRDAIPSICQARIPAACQAVSPS